MQGILQSRYYNLGENKVGKYFVQMGSQAKSSGIKIPKVHGNEKGIRSEYTTRKASYETNSSYQNKRRVSNKTKVRLRQSPFEV